MIRRILLNGPLNFRDLGGYPTADGRQVAWRRLFRSDNLWRVDDADLAVLADEIGLERIIDLRSKDEIERYGRGPLEATDIDYHHVPLLERQHSDTFPTESLIELYIGMAANTPEQIGRAVTLLAESHGRPAVFHCAAGKDRTGIVAAITLTLLGVAREDVVADYTLTAEIVPAMLARYRAAAQQNGVELDEAGIDRSFQAGPEIITEFLEHLDATYGSVPAFAAHAGVGPDAVDALQRALLVEPLA